MQALYILGGLLVGVSTTAINMRGYTSWALITLLGVIIIIGAVYWEHRNKL
jgi:hypothetical protein